MTTITMKEVAAFLLGEAPLDGFWFGERHPAGGFWWREHLRAALAAPATTPAPPAPEPPPFDEIALVRAVLKGYPASMARDDAIRALNVIEGRPAIKAPATAPDELERKPMTKGQREQVVRRAEGAMNSNTNLSWRDALMYETEAFHGIKDKP